MSRWQLGLLLDEELGLGGSESTEILRKERMWRKGRKGVATVGWRSTGMGVRWGPRVPSRQGLEETPALPPTRKLS